MSNPISHPQQAINRLSLLSSPTTSSTSVHPVNLDAETTGNPDAHAFWLNAARGIDWIKAPTKAYGVADGDVNPSWFPDATFNTCYNAVDRHVLNGRGDRVAFHHFRALPTEATRSVTYNELLDEVVHLAGVLSGLGVSKGDTVVIYMPMVLETAYAMLACARIGAIHSVVFGGFAAKELAKRISDAKPRLIISASCGIEGKKGFLAYKPILDESLLHTAHRAPLLMLARQGLEGHQPPALRRDRQEYDWTDEMARIRREGKGVKACAEVKSSDPLYILYTSGTTGLPKGVVRQGGGHAVATRLALSQTFGLGPRDTMFCASDFGWVVGHSYILYGPLLLGCTSVIFEGKPILPDSGVFFRVCEQFKVTCLFTAPTALRAIGREDPDATLMKRHDLSTLRSILLAGERSEPAIVQKFQRLLAEVGAPGAIVNDNYWSTESGSPITALSHNEAFPPLSARPGSAGLAQPGMDVRVVDEEGQELARGMMGNLVLGLPLPPSALGTLWQDPRRFKKAYFSRFAGRFFDTGDAGVIDQDGYVSVLARADDVINVAGHRLGTSLIEQVVSAHPFIAECCVVGRPDPIKGHLPFALVVRAASGEAQAADAGQILQAVNKQVREDIGSIATLGDLVCAVRLPKTRSGKTLRRTVKDLVENAASGNPDGPANYPPTIEDVAVVAEVRQAINDYFRKTSAKL